MKTNWFRTEIRPARKGGVNIHPTQQSHPFHWHEKATRNPYWVLFTPTGFATSVRIVPADWALLGGLAEHCDAVLPDAAPVAHDMTVLPIENTFEDVDGFT